MQIDYTAKRSIQTGHSSGTAYTINVDVTKNDRTSKMTGALHKSLNGSQVTTLHDSEVYLSLTTVLVGASTTPDIDDMREFLDSVKGGETFEVDSVEVVLSSITSPYTETRFAEKYFRYSFQVRQL